MLEEKRKGSDMTRLTITFDENEVEALRSAALQAMRPTKDHARFLIALGLGLTKRASDLIVVRWRDYTDADRLRVASICSRGGKHLVSVCQGVIRNGEILTWEYPVISANAITSILPDEIDAYLAAAHEAVEISLAWHRETEKNAP